MGIRSKLKNLSLERISSGNHHLTDDKPTPDPLAVREDSYKDAEEVTRRSKLVPEPPEILVQLHHSVASPSSVEPMAVTDHAALERAVNLPFQNWGVRTLQLLKKQRPACGFKSVYTSHAPSTYQTVRRLVT